MRSRGYSGRESFVLVAAVLLLGGMHAAMAQGASYTLAPVGPQGLGHTAFYGYNPSGYPSHLFVGNAFESVDEGESWAPMLSRIPGLAGVVIEDRSEVHTLYMSCYPGPFARSQDDGQTWQVVSAPFGENNRGWQLAQDAAGVLILQASADGVTFSLYASSDRGATWQPIRVNKGKALLQDGGYIFPFWADPVIPSMLYAFHNSSNNSAFLVTTDGGKNWVRREKGMPHRSNGRLPKAFNFSSLAQSSTSPYTIYGFGDLIVAHGYYSDDRGKHWHAVKTISGDVAGIDKFGTLHVKPGTNNVLWALARQMNPEDVRFAESLDKGNSWTVKGPILLSEGWTEDQLCGWSCPSIVPRYSDTARDLATHLLVSKSGHIIINKLPQGLLLSADGGNTFEVHNAGATGWSFDQLFRASDGAIFASSHEPYLWRSADGGQSWRLADWAPFISLHDRGDGTIFGLDWVNDIVGYGHGRMVFLGTGPSVGYSYPAFEWIDSGSLQRIIIGGCIDKATFYRSDDLGATWTTLGTAPMLTGLTALSADPRNPDHLVAAGWFGASSPAYESPYDAQTGGIYCSTDGGMTWTAAMDANAIGGVTCLYRDKNNPDIMVASATGYAQPPGAQGGVFVSEDGGFTWASRGDGLPSYKPGNSARMISSVVSPPDGPTLFAAVQLNGGFYRSADLGLSWTKIADLPMRLPDDYINSGDFTIKRTAVTQILPLNDGTGSFLTATMGHGIFKGTPVSAKAIATR